MNSLTLLSLRSPTLLQVDKVGEAEEATDLRHELITSLSLHSIACGVTHLLQLGSV